MGIGSLPSSIDEVMVEHWNETKNKKKSYKRKRAGKRKNEETGERRESGRKEGWWKLSLVMTTDKTDGQRRKTDFRLLLLFIYFIIIIPSTSIDWLETLSLQFTGQPPDY